MESTRHTRFNTRSDHISLSRSVVQRGWEGIMDVVNEGEKARWLCFAVRNSGPIHRHKRAVVPCLTDKLAYAMLSSLK